MWTNRDSVLDRIFRLIVGRDAQWFPDNQAAAKIIGVGSIKSDPRMLYTLFQNCLHESELESKYIFRWFYSRIVCVLHDLLVWKGGFRSPLSYPLSCPVGTLFVLAVFQAWRNCLLSFTLAFQHFLFHFFGLGFLVEMLNSESEAC